MVNRVKKTQSTINICEGPVHYYHDKYWDVLEILPNLGRAPDNIIEI